MTKSALLARLGGIAAIFLLALIVYLPIIRPWQLRWGATDAEVTRDLPGTVTTGSTTVANPVPTGSSRNYSWSRWVTPFRSRLASTS
jgi:hypothetical protein